MVIRFSAIIPAPATELFEVNFEIRSGPAILAPPVVATQHLPAKSFVHVQFQFQSAALGGECGSRGFFGSFVQKSLALSRLN